MPKSPCPVAQHSSESFSRGWDIIHGLLLSKPNSIQPSQHRTIFSSIKQLLLLFSVLFLLARQLELCNPDFTFDLNRVPWRLLLSIENLERMYRKSSLTPMGTIDICEWLPCNFSCKICHIVKMLSIAVNQWMGEMFFVYNGCDNISTRIFTFLDISFHRIATLVTWQGMGYQIQEGLPYEAFTTANIDFQLVATWTPYQSPTLQVQML